MSERYQREIEEILQQVGESTPIREPGKAEKGSPLSALGRFGGGIASQAYRSSRRLMTIGIILLALAILLSAIAPGLWGPVAWLVLILFVLTYALFFARPSGGPAKRWRGRSIDPPAGQEDSAWRRFQRWMKRQ